MTDIVSLSSTGTSGSVAANNTSTTSGSVETLNHGTSTPTSDNAIDFDQQLVASNVLDDSGESSNAETTTSSLSSSSISDDGLVAQSTAPLDVSERLDYHAGRVQQHIVNNEVQLTGSGHALDHRIEDPAFARDVEAYRDIVQFARWSVDRGDTSIDADQLQQHEAFLSVAELKVPVPEESMNHDPLLDDIVQRRQLYQMAPDTTGGEVGALAIAKEIHETLTPSLPEGHLINQTTGLFGEQAERIRTANTSADNLERLMNIAESDPSPENMRALAQATEQFVNDVKAVETGQIGYVDPETVEQWSGPVNLVRDLSISASTLLGGPELGAAVAVGTRTEGYEASIALGEEPFLQSSPLDDAINIGASSITRLGLEKTEGLVTRWAGDLSGIQRFGVRMSGHALTDTVSEGFGQGARALAGGLDAEGMSRLRETWLPSAGLSIVSSSVQAGLTTYTPLSSTQAAAALEPAEAVLRQGYIELKARQAGENAQIEVDAGDAQQDLSQIYGSLPPSADTSSYPIWVEDVGVDANGWREQMRMFRQDTPAGNVFYAEDADGMRYQLDASTQTGAEQEIRNNISHDGFSNPIRQSLLGQLPSSADTTSRPVWTNDVGIDQNGERSMMRIYRQDTTAGSVYYAEDAIGVRYPLDAITQVGAEQEARNGIQYGAYSNPIVQDLPSASSSFSPSIPSSPAVTGTLPSSANTSSYPIWTNDVGIDSGGTREMMRIFRQDTPAGSVFYAEDGNGSRYQLDAITQYGAEQEVRTGIQYDAYSNPIRQQL